MSGTQRMNDRGTERNLRVFRGRAGHRAHATSATAAGPVDRYLTEMAEVLVAPAPERMAVVREIGDGLTETIAGYRALGLPEEEAMSAAVAEFGEPRVVAAAVQAELGVRQARRSALALMASGPVVGIAWLAGAAVTSLSPARHQMFALLWALPLVGAAIIVAVPVLVGTLVATGRAGLRLALPPRLPPTAVTIASVAAVTADVTMLTIAGLYLAITSATPGWPLVPAVVASLVRICLATRAFWGCRRAAITLT